MGHEFMIKIKKIANVAMKAKKEIPPKEHWLEKVFLK